MVKMIQKLRIKNKKVKGWVYLLILKNDKEALAEFLIRRKVLINQVLILVEIGLKVWKIQRIIIY
jgi:hypothetical protein